MIWFLLFHFSLSTKYVVNKHPINMCLNDNRWGGACCLHSIRENDFGEINSSTFSFTILFILFYCSDSLFGRQGRKKNSGVTKISNIKGSRSQMCYFVLHNFNRDLGFLDSVVFVQVKCKVSRGSRVDALWKCLLIYLVDFSLHVGRHQLLILPLAADAPICSP